MVGERLVVRVLCVVLFGIESAQENQALSREPHCDESHQTKDSEYEVIDTFFEKFHVQPRVRRCQRPFRRRFTLRKQVIEPTPFALEYLFYLSHQ